MEQKQTLAVVDAQGRQGWLEQAPFPGRESPLLVRFADNEQVLVPADLLIRQEDGSFYLPINSGEAHQGRKPAQRAEQLIAVPVIAEELQVQKRSVESGVRITKQVHERQETVDTPTYAEEIEVQRVPINRQVFEPVDVRQEGDTLIVPLLEEVVVVEKQLWLREEVHITKRRTEQRQQEQVALRREEVQVTPLASTAPLSASPEANSQPKQ